MDPLGKGFELKLYGLGAFKGFGFRGLGFRVSRVWTTNFCWKASRRRAKQCKGCSSFVFCLHALNTVDDQNPALPIIRNIP